MRLRDAWAIRRADAGDLAAITAMYQADGFRHAQGDPERAAFYYAMVRAAGGEVLVAAEGGEVVGHLEWLPCLEAPPLGRYGYLETLEVRADRRHRGIGRALVEAALAGARAAGAARMEVVAEDGRSAALYASAGFRPGPRFLDLDLVVPAAALGEAAAPRRPLPPGSRPWLARRHVAGRQYPAAYCWARAYLAATWGLPEAEGAGAWWVGEDAVALADPWLVHLFLPPELPPEVPAAWPAWLAAFALRARQWEGRVRTVVEAELAARLGLPGRWPGGTAGAFTLLVRPLD